MLLVECGSFDAGYVKYFSAHILCVHRINILLDRLPLFTSHGFHFRLRDVELRHRDHVDLVPGSNNKCIVDVNSIPNVLEKIYVPLLALKTKSET